MKKNPNSADVKAYIEATFKSLYTTASLILWCLRIHVITTFLAFSAADNKSMEGSNANIY